MLPGDLVEAETFQRVNREIVDEGGTTGPGSIGVVGDHKGVAQYRQLPLGEFVPAHDQGVSRGGDCA